MIRQATASDFPIAVSDECAIRIDSLMLAYGADAPFVRFYTDDYGSMMSLMDATAVLYCCENAEEWAFFITMNPEILHVHCSAAFGRLLASVGGWQGREGVVLKYGGNADAVADCVCEAPYLPNVHALLCACFDEMAPLNAWYPDVSHRMRHDCCKIAVVLDGETVVSTAMTVAETDTSALLGQVATHHEYRGRGYAKTCINSLISRCKGKSLYILPMTEYARSLYEKMEFYPDGDWAELQRI